MINTSKNSVLYTKSLSKDDFEYVDSCSSPEKRLPSNNESLSIVSNADNNDIPETIDFTFLTKDTLSTFCDDNGRVVDESKLRHAVFNGGCCLEVRQKVWSFLFGLYPMTSTERERKEHYYQNYFKYQALKKKCFDLLYSDQDISKVNLSLSEHTFNNLDLVKSDYHKNLAEIFAEKQTFDLEFVHNWLNIIDKDIPRTDIDHPYFQKHTKESLKQMKNILVIFGFFHPSIGYLQGMNDILTRFMVVLESEVDAYWCFSNYMESVEHDFSETGMIEKIELVSSLLQDLEPNLFSHFCNCGVRDMFFCHRWLLVSFKREFEYEESIRYFEIVQSQYLNFASQTALSAQDDQYRQEVMKQEGRSVNCPSFETVKYTLDLFICVSVIMLKRQEFLACKDTADVFHVACNIRGSLNLEDVHRKAYGLFIKYCRKYVAENCAQQEKGIVKTVTDTLQSISGRIPSFKDLGLNFKLN